MREVRRTKKVTRRQVLETNDPQQAKKERVKVRRPAAKMVRLRIDWDGEGEEYSMKSSQRPSKVMRTPVMRTMRLTEQMVARNNLLQQPVHIVTTNLELGQNSRR